MGTLWIGRDPKNQETPGAGANEQGAEDSLRWWRDVRSSEHSPACAKAPAGRVNAVPLKPAIILEEFSSPAFEQKSPRAKRHLAWQSAMRIASVESCGVFWRRGTQFVAQSD